jgi:hypothetical protein
MCGASPDPVFRRLGVAKPGVAAQTEMTDQIA